MNVTEPSFVVLLDADPDLGALLSAEELESARRQLTVHRLTVEPGPWDGERLRDAGAEHLGLLVLDGLMTRELALADNVSAELLGPGDLVRPWQATGPERLVPYDVRWNALERTELGVLDRHFAALLPRYPQVNAMLVDRLVGRSQRLSLMQSISQLNGVERRLHTLFWHLAERWGRVTSAGVVVSLSVPHRVLANLVGARRPTVSSALRRLGESGDLSREPDGSWLLTGAPVGLPTDAAARIVRMRRFRAERPPVAAEAQEPPALTGRLGEMHDAVSTLRADSKRRHEEFAALAEHTRELMERLDALRVERQAAPSRR